ncbi:MAG TPA: sulfatase [Chitinophagaceae bacterium]|nr:sulfatase [Chitinophagaceae bacterium]
MIYRLIVLCLLAVSSKAQRPNIIYIMSDDHDADAISAYNNKFIATPNMDRIAKEGMRFTNCFVGNSICSPVRATVLTGQHSHLNGIKDNRTPFDGSKITLPKLLKEAGYQTVLVGKWHLHSLPTGFDYWTILPGQGAYYSTRLINMNNDTISYNSYATTLITDQALGWLKEKRDPAKPFFLMMHHKAPHRNWVPDLKWLEVFSKKTFPEPPTLYADTTGKGTAFKHQRMSILKDMTLCTDLKIDPQYIMDIDHLKPDSNEIRSYKAFMNAIPEEQRKRMKEIFAERGKVLQQMKPTGKELLKLKYQWYLQDYLACIASVDESVGQLLNYLDESSLSGNTMVIYTSDQGFYLGENGWFDKRFMYDVSMQTPLLVRWKGKIKPGAVNTSLVQNIDFAPTMLEAAGVNVPNWMQGLSLNSILTGKQDVPTAIGIPRTELYYRYYEYPIDHYVMPHIGLREKQYKLIYFYTANEWEFYDLKADPREQKNLILIPKYLAEINRMKMKLVEVKNKYKDPEPAGELK